MITEATAAGSGTTARRRRGRLRLGLAALTVLLATSVGIGAGPAAEAHSGADPILFVHGWNSSASAWNTMIDRFVGAGHARSSMLAITYNSNQSNATIANQVRDAVNSLRASTGASRVDIVTHSMGGLSSRYYLKNLGGAGSSGSSASVDEWVSLGGPNHGTNTAYLCYPFSAGCRDMVPGSGFLNSLNSGDETPGGVRYGTFWSSCDEVINPDDSVLLSGATNTGVGCLGHSALRTDANVFDQVHSFTT
jgi:triacylglycerol lipase